MVILDLDHPDIETFIEWKAIEEDKARALIAAGYPADFQWRSVCNCLRTKLKQLCKSTYRIL